MPTWGHILTELGNAKTSQGQTDFDTVRRKYLVELAGYTGRSTILYASQFLTPGIGDPNAGSINLSDMQAMMEVVNGLPGPDLDLILHTPGGSAEALESVVRYLRTKYTHIRAFVPLAAMSAGTMWALACDEIVMGKHSQLGPIDPQFFLAFGEQIRATPAQAILDQFQHAQEQCARDPTKLPTWVTVLRSYGPSLLQECLRAQSLSKALVSQWLQTYMLKGDPNAADTAAQIAETFADYTVHQSHGRPIDRDLARSYGLLITDLEADQTLQDAVLSVHHATMHTLSGTPTAKIVENNLGRAFIVQAGAIMVGTPASPASPNTPTSTPPQRAIGNPNRQHKNQRKKR